MSWNTFRGSGQQIVERNGHYHLYGTLRVQNETCRVRETTGICVDAPNALDNANAVRVARENELMNQLVHGVGRGMTWLDAAVVYAENRQMKRHERGLSKKLSGDTEYQAVVRFTKFLEERNKHNCAIHEVSRNDVEDYLRKIHASKGHKTETIMRTWAPLRAVFNLAKIDMEEPSFFKHKKLHDPKKTLVKGKWLYPEEVVLLIKCAAPHLQPILAIDWNTGNRIGELLWVKKEEPKEKDKSTSWLCLTEGDEHIYLGQTKNGNPRIEPLNDVCVMILQKMLKSRKDEHDALFLTNRGVPYNRPNTKRGGNIKSGFKAAKEKAARILEAERKEDRAKVMRQVTPHWARHNKTSHLLSEGLSPHQVQDMMGWSSIDMVKRYDGDYDGGDRKRANIVQFNVDIEISEPKGQPDNKPKKTKRSPST